MTNPEYYEWCSKRVNDNIPEPNHKNSQSIEEHLRVIPSELEIIKLDADVQKLDTERLKKGKTKADEDLDSLKTDYRSCAY
ncbi:hypothetical protein Golob_000036 [Gossypium lobatum]|uniref:ATP synthase subunit d, mitochondrial n=1 Tax=Gossypium lobatum TaxID=34289 RepID=A0A7J8NI62_9ROSI|nr:hypothetical protein [Gossypium lobatum]